MRGHSLALVCGAAILALIAPGCRSGTELEAEPLPPLLQVPKAYWAEAQATIALDDLTVPGLVRFDYLVYPDQRVTIPNLLVRMDDLDLVVNFLWWETKREPLRCTTFGNEKAIEGVLEDGELSIPAGAKVLAVSYFARDRDGECRGLARRLDTQSNDELRAVHDPEGNRFALSASFETSIEGNDVTVALEAEGHYLNRPPVAALEATGEGVVVAADGCPVTEKGNPPIAVANTEGGLLVTLRSTSYDPDGNWPAEHHPKRPRVDLSFEQWTVRSGPGGFRFLGTGREIGPVLFKTGQEHQLLL